MAKILHAADFHLDSAFSGLSPEQAAQRRQEQRQTLHALSKLGQDCDIILLSGDLFDTDRVYRDTLDALKECFASLPGSIFIAPGNHDPLIPGSPYLTQDWGSNVHIFNSSEIQRVQYGDFDIYGAAFTSGEMPSMLRGFRVADTSRKSLMVLHGDLQPGSVYNHLSPGEISATGLTYLALGHTHTMQIHKFGAVSCAYAGCLMGRGFDECGEKGVLIFDTDKGKPEFHPIASRRYEILSVEAGNDPLRSVLGALPEDTERDCYRIILTGEAERIDTDALTAQLADRFYSLSLRDHTVPAKALWDGCGEDTLRGSFLRKMKERYDAASEDERSTVIQALRIMTDLMDGREVHL